MFLLIRKSIVGSILLFGLYNFSLSQTPSFPGHLPQPSYGVGFRSLWQFDYSRTYNILFDDKTVYSKLKAPPRPILINIWYPAASGIGMSKTMMHRDYLDIESNDPQLKNFSQKLIEYNRNIIVQEIMAKPENQLSAEEKSLFEGFVKSPTAAFRNAVPLPGQFPLIIYHPGAGSSIEDDTMLCEFLAGNGYVVINSAFQRADGYTLNIDGQSGSVQDVKFLISYASRMTYVDPQRIGILGHSAGAQACLIFQSQNKSIARAVVSLDTSEDYHSLATSGWESMTKSVLDNVGNMGSPMLIVARRSAVFEMCDLLKNSERYYLTVRNLSHNDFIWQGIIHETLKYELQKLKTKNPQDESNDQKLRQDLDSLGQDYDAVCLYSLNFLNAQLKNDQEGKNYLLAKYRDNQIAGLNPFVEYVPHGIVSAETYNLISLVPPTPRQIRHIIDHDGFEQMMTLLKKFSKKDNTHPIYDLNFAYCWIDGMLDEKKTIQAKAIYKLYTELDDKFRTIPQSMMDLGKALLKIRAKQMASTCFRKVLVLEPNNPTAAFMLRESEIK